MSNAMPIFYSKPEAINPKTHGDVKLVAVQGFDYAAKANVVPIMAAEMPAAMRSYPIVFAGDGFMPVAITGVREGENLFINSDDKWTEPHYVPAYVRRYPFILAGDNDAERLTLCLEPDAKRVLDGGKKAPKDADLVDLFDKDQPSEATKKALEFCEHYQAMNNATRQIVDAVAKKDLFVKRSSTINLDDGEVLKLTDFRIIDEAALNKLSDADFLELRKVGALSMIYCHLASMNSWQALVWQTTQSGKKKTKTSTDTNGASAPSSGKTTQ